MMMRILYYRFYRNLQIHFILSLNWLGHIHYKIPINVRPHSLRHHKADNTTLIFYHSCIFHPCSFLATFSVLYIWQCCILCSYIFIFPLTYVPDSSTPGKMVQQQLSRKLLTNPSPTDTHEHISVHTSLPSPHGRLLEEPRWPLVMPVGQSFVSDSLQPSGHLAPPNSYITMNLNHFQWSKH